MDRLDNPIDSLCLQAVALAKLDENRKPDKKINPSTTICWDEESGTFILLDGSAHMMEGCLKDMFRKRPELRAVMQKVLDDMFVIADR